MDLKHTTTTLTTPMTAPNSPDADGEPQLITPFSSYPNGNKHHHNYHHIPPPSMMTSSYKECLKNHAANIGSHALDGCGEFMTSQPPSLTCAACGCHRNFHRREPITTTANFLDFQHACAPPVLLSLTSGDHHQAHHVATPGTPAAIKIENPNGRKRFRTKFSQEQKEKMSLFAEKIGWKMQRCDDKMVMDFCNGVGIRRGIFKVWMHNNKNTLGKKDGKDSMSLPVTGTGGADVMITGGMETMGGGEKRVGVVHSNDGGDGVVSSESHEDVNVNGGGDDGSDQENGGYGGGNHGGGGDGGGNHGGGGDGGGAMLGSTNGSSSSW